jgi:hypothetical protein
LNVVAQRACFHVTDNADDFQPSAVRDSDALAERAIAQELARKRLVHPRERPVLFDVIARRNTPGEKWHAERLEVFGGDAAIHCVWPAPMQLGS